MTDDYRKMLLELYQENQAFLDKAIFTISVLAIPFLFKSLNEDVLDFTSRSIFTASLLCFFVVITLQIFSLKFARDGCDEGLLGKKPNKSEKYFDIARTLDKFKEIFFLGSLFLIALVFTLNLINMENHMTDEFKKSKNIEQKSFIPPKSVVSAENDSEKKEPAEGNTTQNKDK